MPSACSNVTMTGMDESPQAAFGAAVLSATLRARPEDFVVEELPAFEPSGQGEHCLLTIEKRGLTTVEVAARLARWAGIAPMGVGYAGQKDRNAVARQRFSVHLPHRVLPDPSALQGDDLRVLDHAWHARKLPRGALAGNRFRLRLHGVRGEHALIEQRLLALQARGLPNAFGRQRFGRDGDNLPQVRALFAGGRARIGREKRAMLLSAARSHLFNRVLAARIAQDAWDRGLDGEVWMLDGSHSVFGPVPMDAALAARVTGQDIHPTGPLWGDGPLRSRGAVAALEHAALADAEAQALCEGLQRAGLRQERRALRVPLRSLAWQWCPEASGAGGRATDPMGTSTAPATLELQFDLPPGSYATTLLDQLGACEDARGAGTAIEPAADD